MLVADDAAGSGRCSDGEAAGSPAGEGLLMETMALLLINWERPCNSSGQVWNVIGPPELQIMGPSGEGVISRFRTQISRNSGTRAPPVFYRPRPSSLFWDNAGFDAQFHWPPGNLTSLLKGAR